MLGIQKATRASSSKARIGRQKFHDMCKYNTSTQLGINMSASMSPFPVALSEVGDRKFGQSCPKATDSKHYP